MIDHFTLSVTDGPASKTFFTSILAPLGYRPLMDFEQFSGFGDEKPYFWLKQAETPTTPQHIAFAASSREAVDAFRAAALAAGAKDDGKPGVLRELYHPNYYAAFVSDPVNGHPDEAVCPLSLDALSGAKKATAKPAAKKASAKPVAKRRKPEARQVGQSREEEVEALICSATLVDETGSTTPHLCHGAARYPVAARVFGCRHHDAFGSARRSKKTLRSRSKPASGSPVRPRPLRGPMSRSRRLRTRPQPRTRRRSGGRSPSRLPSTTSG